ncbi:MAG TPA: N-acetylmuramoyl-L-alanine amidase [Steroidobacteraceae bacterium]|nr:N-acetylmuramoyl-L-alanine amidase [Steroidobacteraceae bacterium]
MVRTLWRAGMAAAVLISLPSLASAAAQLQKAELRSASADSVQLVLGLSAATAPKVFTLDSPDRVVIDLPATRLASSVRMPAAVGPVRTLRSGMQDRHTLRLVLQLDRPLAPQLQNRGSQVVVNLGSAAAAPATPAVPVPVRAAHAPADEGRDIIVAIDAGHGGQDPGASGRSGTREKDVVLAIARALARRIDAEPGMKAYLTRDEDRFIPLRERINLARKARADIFVSIHADSIRNRDVSGSSVYVLADRGASSEAARWLAEQENAADLKGGVSLGDKSDELAAVLMDVSQSASIGSSMVAAERVLSQLDRVGTIRKTEVQRAAFVVLKSPDIPSMLVETAYISNPAEERKLRTAAHQQAIAEAIFGGVRDHFRTSPPDGSLFARQRESRRGAAPIIAGSAAP